MTTQPYNPIILSTRSTERESNFELFRIICMLMIILRHFIIHPNGGNSILATSESGMLLDSLCYVGVNCFVLISGWFKIRFTWKGLLNLYIICAFYSALNYLFHIIDTGSSFGRSFVYATLFPFSHSTWWFINAYLILYFCAPLINLALKSINGKEDLMILGLLTIINVYFGNIRQAPLFNDSGYNGSHLIYIYWLGACLKKYTNQEWVQRSRWPLLVCYVFFSICLLFATLFKKRIDFEWLNIGYNNPLTLLASCSLFLFASSFHFKSKSVNYLAQSTLALYLIQESLFFGRGWLYPYLGNIYESHPSLGIQLLILIIVTLIFSCFAILIDQTRILLRSLVFKLLYSCFPSLKK